MNKIALHWKIGIGMLLGIALSFLLIRFEVSVFALFIAQAVGMNLSIEIQAGIIVTATLASIGTATIQGKGLNLIFAIGRPLDMLRTTINITGNTIVAMLITKSENKLEEPTIIHNTHHLF